MNMFDARYDELENEFTEAAEENEISLEDFLRYELVSSWDRRILEDQEFIAAWEKRNAAK